MASPPGRPHRHAVLARLTALVVGLVLVAALWTAVDAARVLAVLVAADRGWLAVGFALLVPAILGSAWRFRALAPADGRPGPGEAVALVLAASALNQVLPAKVGDIAKAWWLASTGKLEAARALALVALEKLTDLAALLALAGAGLAALAPGSPLYGTLAAAIAAGLAACGVFLASPRAMQGLLARLGRVERARRLIERLVAAWAEARSSLLERPARLLAVALGSLAIWLVLLAQVWAFARALGADLPLGTAIALAPLAILAGLLPLTFAGIGTRDAALVVVFAGHLEPPVAAALGVLMTARYLATAACGLPFCVAGPAARARAWAAGGR